MMFGFIWILFSLAVAFEAKLKRRDPGIWFLAAIFASPLLAGAALIMAERRGWR